MSAERGRERTKKLDSVSCTHLDVVERLRVREREESEPLSLKDGQVNVIMEREDSEHCFADHQVLQLKPTAFLKTGSAWSKRLGFRWREKG